MWRLEHDFLFEQNITKEQFQALKRVPHFGWHYGADVVRFVSGYLPLLGAVLWKRGMDLNLLQFSHVVDTLQRSKLDTAEKAASSVPRLEKNEKAREKRFTRNKTTSNHVNQINYERHTRSGQWGICK